MSEEKENKERFLQIFGTSPSEFLTNGDPYFYQQYGQEGRELLEYFKICPECDGSGTAHTECCNGYRCPCNGVAVAFSCQRCNSTGKLEENNIQDSNRNYITQRAEANNGFLF